VPWPSQAGKEQTKNRKARASREGCHTLALEKRLADALGLAVIVDHRSRGGSLTIRYRSLDRLDEVVRRSREGVYYGAAATVCPGGKIRNKKNVAC